MKRDSVFKVSVWICPDPILNLKAHCFEDCVTWSHAALYRLMAVNLAELWCRYSDGSKYSNRNLVIAAGGVGKSPN